MPEPKVESPEVDIDQKVDAFFDGKEGTEPEESSPSKSEQSEDTEPKDDVGDDQPKKSDSEGEEKEDGDKEADPRDLAFRKGYNEAKSKLSKELEELKKSIPPKEQLEQFTKTINSPEYIRASMKAQGYTDEAINSRLTDAGHKVLPKTEDDFQFVLKSMGIDPEKLDENGKNYVNTYIADVVKVAGTLVDHKLKSILPDTIKPIQERLDKADAEKSGHEITKQMKSIVKDEGILDFEKDVEPELHKFMDSNETASQKEIMDHFQSLTRRLNIERLKLGKKKVDREETKKGLRGSKETNNVDTTKTPQRGDKESEDEYLDRLLDFHNIH